MNKSTFNDRATRALAALSVGLAFQLFAAPNAEGTCPGGDTGVGPATDSPLIPTASVGASTLGAPVPHPFLVSTSPAEGASVVVADDLVHITSLEDHSPLGTSLAGDTITGAPVPVTLEDRVLYIFVVRDSGVLEKLDASGSSLWTVDLTHGETGDTLSSTPAVHLYRHASSAFQAKYVDGMGDGFDLVYVATTHGGTNGDEDNRVYAVNADTGAIVWIFNNGWDGMGSGVDMDAALAAPFLDYASDRLIVGTDRTNPSQDSLFSIDVISASLSWSVNVGQVWTAPQLRDSIIYVATLFGDIKALSATDGSTLWTYSGAKPIMVDFFHEFRGAYPDLISYVDYFGDVSVVRDDGSSGSHVWTSTLATGVKATGRPAIDAANGKLYVGANDGELYQLNLTDGAVEANREIDSGMGTGTVGHAGLVFEGSDVNILVGASTGDLAKFCGPWTVEAGVGAPATAKASEPSPNMSLLAAVVGPCASDAECQGTLPFQECTEFQCIDSVCVSVPINNGATCTGDPLLETDVDTCQAGTCVGPSDCQRDLDVCKCIDKQGGTVDREISIGHEDCLGPPTGGSTLPGEWCGREISASVGQNTCIAHGSPTAAVLWVHLLDKDRLPFVIDPNDGTGSDVTMQICGAPGVNCTQFGAGTGTRPRFLNPFATIPDPTSPLMDNGSPAQPVTEVSLSGGTLRASSRKGTYYAYIAPDTVDGDSGSFPWTIQTTVIKNYPSGGGSCVDLNLSSTETLFTKVFVKDASQQNGDCPFDSDENEMGYLTVEVVDSAGFGIKDMRVRLGYSNDLRLARNFEEAVTDNPLGENLKTTNDDGLATFIDYGNYMNGGPDIVFDTGTSTVTFERMHVFIECPAGGFQRVVVDSSHIKHVCD